MTWERERRGVDLGAMLERGEIDTVVVKREPANEHPNLVKAVYRAFCTTKDRVQEQYVKRMTFNNMSIMLPCSAT
jgi:hypothetical protein